MRFGFVAYANGHHSGMRAFDPSADTYHQQYAQAVGQPQSIEAIPQMLLDQGLIGAALLLCGIIIWKLAKKMEVMNDKILDLVQHDSELKAKLVTHMEGVERELERIRRNGHG
tara:strand:+ start:184 stop:522 length:339 start_codon:yes stop_codon:yes gene_type:complete